MKKATQKAPPLAAEDITNLDSLESNAQAQPTFRISTTIKSIGEGGVRDCNLADILNRSAGRTDCREADTPLMNQAKAKPKSGFPNFRESSSLSANAFNPDSIATPHTYAKVTAPGSPRNSPVASDMFAFLKQTFKRDTLTFTYRQSKQQAAAFGADLIKLCAEAISHFEKEPLYLTLPLNIFVIGDIHGNYADLSYFMSELLLFNDIEITPYSFLSLGDYVDRGDHSVECVALCLALKCLSPTTFFMLRGNHEDPGINGDTDTYGMDCFQSQAKLIFGDSVGMTVWESVNAVFKVLPLAASVGGKIFCSHGGIPRYYGPVEDDDRLALLQSPDFPRFRSLFEPLDMSVLGKEKMERCWVAAFDLMWSDPSEDDTEMNEYGFGRNDRGNCIITFSEVAVDNFLKANKLELMFRAHQEKSDGLKISKSAQCLTIFSSSNYQGHGNGAGVIYVSAKGNIKLIMKEGSSQS
eukprot:NODE_1325_length_1550_cov_33.947294_g1253_i0.p1 GENE.NODE_1325_length_1550_cov_33.947294_g1253_i0~~NODE_1325_length_1550_cov_33.947294_g1253_i0.p1  ORF type:complete len:468 (-),score=122.18 NODE_1325_length_1550_cov_33.947294_g1253_i0:54-1457(-)